VGSKSMSERARWDSIGPPPIWLFAVEQARALSELAKLIARRDLAKRMRPGDGHTVFVLPGFLAGDYSTFPLRRFLHQLHYDTHGWKEGVNFGPNGETLERIGARLVQIHERHGRKLSLVGWSLGGIYAREFARRNRARVRSVITMGTPFRDVTATHAARLIAMRAGPSPDQLDEIRNDLRQPIPVPCTSIFSKTDGVVNWRSCLQDEGPECENIEVQCSHTGMGFHPAALAIVANRLALSEGEWHPYSQAQTKTGS
jgi:pimeloyl-ACP methyl ester carboxylesterase